MSSTVVYGVSVDSRSRNPNEPDNSYSVNLARTMDRVKSLQLGSFQFQDTRPAFDDTAKLYYSEPIVIPAGTILRYKQTTSVLSKTTQALTTSSRTLSIILPPTLNKIILLATSGSWQRLHAEDDVGLLFAVTFFPLVGMRMRAVGSDFPQSLAAVVTPGFPTDSPEPVFTAATTDPPYYDNNNKRFRVSTAYLTELSSGVGSLRSRFNDPTGTPDNSNAYLYSPPPTLVELLIMINAATTYMLDRTDLTNTVAAATNTTPILITSSTSSRLSSGDQVVISGVTGNTAANGTWFIVMGNAANTFTLDGSEGNGGYTGGGDIFSPQKLDMPATFGLDADNNTLACHAPKRVTETQNDITTVSLELQGTLATLIGFPQASTLDPAAVTTLSQDVQRQVQLKKGTFTGPEVAAETTARLNPTRFLVEDPDARTLHYRLPSGVSAQLILPYGSYSGDQLADYMNVSLASEPANITLAYNPTPGTFTFTHNQGHAFGLDFGAADPLMARNLGFDHGVIYTGASLTSVRRAVQGVASTATYPDNQYAVSADTQNSTYTFARQPHPRFYTQAGTSVDKVGGSWTPFALSGEDFAHRFKAGDVLVAQRPLLSSTQTGAAPISAATNAAPIAITTGAAHGLTTGDTLTLERVAGNTAANGIWVVTVTGLTTFTLDGSLGNGTYTTGTGTWWTTISWDASLGAQSPTPTYTVVVQAAWDASTATPLLELEPTPSILSVEDAATPSRQALGAPSTSNGLILLQPFTRGVFMIHSKHPAGQPTSFGFPPYAWPPSQKTFVATRGITPTISDFTAYDPATLSIPVATTYTSPFAWNLRPSDYIVVVIKGSCFAQDRQSHSYRGTSFPIFAKLLVNRAYVNVSEEMHFTTVASLARLKNFTIEFQNPDGSLVDFNGAPHNYTLLFSVQENRASLPCM